MNHKQKLGYMALGADFSVVEARYEIVTGYRATTGYSPSDVMQIWMIRFDKPPHRLRVKNAIEYTLFGTDLHIAAYYSDLIVVSWDGGQRIFAHPFGFTRHGLAYPERTISYSHSPNFDRIEDIIITFTEDNKFLNVGVKDFNIRYSHATEGVRATEIESHSKGRTAVEGGP